MPNYRKQKNSKLCPLFTCLNRLDVYIYDYFIKRNLQATAKAFQAEGKVSSDPVGMPHSFVIFYIIVLIVVICLKLAERLNINFKKEVTIT